VESLLPALPNDREIPDTSRSSDSDISSVVSDVFPGKEGKGGDSDCRSAASLCKQKKFAEAIALIDRETNPSGKCFYIRSNCHLGLGNFEEALLDIKRAEKDLPDYYKNYFTEGTIQSELNRLPESIAAYSKALSLKPDSVRILDARAAAYYRHGQFLPALADYESAILLAPKDLNALYMRGLCYFMLGQYQMVPVCYSDYLALQPDDVSAMANRGTAYYELGKYQDSLVDFDRVLSLEPKDVSSLYKRCLIYWHLGRWQSAFADADLAMSVSGWQDKNSGYIALCLYMMSLKDKRSPQMIVSRALTNLDPKTWPYPIFKYLGGKMSRSDLLAAAGSNEQWLTQARTYVALNELWTGTDPKGAASLLAEVREYGDSSLPEYNLAVDEIFRNQTKDIVNISRPVTGRYALVIGVSKFRDASINLRYSDKDAKDFSDFLINSEGFPAKNVRLLVNEEATRENILGSLGDDWLPRKTNKDDLVLIYFSTHGSPSIMDAKGINYLIAHDTDKKMLFATGIPVQDLTRMVKDKVHADRVVVIMDACHSGAARADDRLKIDAAAMSSESGQAVICSSLPEQVSWESKEYANSVFTHHLIEGLRSRGRKTSIGDSFEYARLNVDKEVWNDRQVHQTPVLKSTWSKPDLSLAQ
jgi:tetratricopeptide (TPR) repeat protein